jgi:hypothetical protein
VKIHTAGSLPNRPTLYLPTGLPYTSRPTYPVPRPSHLPHTSQPAYPVPRPSHLPRTSQPAYPIPLPPPHLLPTSLPYTSLPTRLQERLVASCPVPRLTQPTYPIPRSPNASKTCRVSRLPTHLPYTGRQPEARAPPLLMTPGILPRKARQAVSLAGSCWEI